MRDAALATLALLAIAFLLAQVLHPPNRFLAAITEVSPCQLSTCEVHHPDATRGEER